MVVEEVSLICGFLSLMYQKYRPAPTPAEVSLTTAEGRFDLSKGKFRSDDFCWISLTLPERFMLVVHFERQGHLRDFSHDPPQITECPRSEAAWSACFWYRN